VSTPQVLKSTVQSTTTDVRGRSLNQVGTHHFVIDSAHGPDEEVTPPDVFLSGVSACAVHMVERFAPEAGVHLIRAQATIEGFRSSEDPTFFQHIDLHFEIHGPNQEQAEGLVDTFKRR
jgi:uncharacterized OsmC-like protein